MFALKLPRPQTGPPAEPRPIAACLKPLPPIGELAGFAAETARLTFKRPFQWREFFDQTWFVTRVSLIPACLITVPFGAVLSLQVFILFQQIGAESFTGAIAVLGVLQQASPIVTVTVIAGAAGSAVAADLGARKIRDELDALEVMGISPIHRMVVPRVLAMSYVALLLNVITSAVGVIGGYLFNVVVQGGSPGAYLHAFTSLAQLPDLYIGAVKSVIFGLLAGIVAAHQGMNAKGGPQGVGDAVNRAVVISFVLLFLVNLVLSTLYYQIVPPKGL